MSWAPKDLEDELLDDLSSLTIQESPSLFNTVTEENIPVIIKKLDKVKKPKTKKQNEAASEVVLSITESLRMHGIESNDAIPKSSPLFACISKNDFSDPKYPLILEEKYFTMKSTNHACTSNQANKTRALPKQSICEQQLNEPWGKTVKEAQDVQRWSSSPKPGEVVTCPVVSNCPVNKSTKSLKQRKKLKMIKFDLTPQEDPQKTNKMAPPGVRGICFI